MSNFSVWPHGITTVPGPKGYRIFQIRLACLCGTSLVRLAWRSRRVSDTEVTCALAGGGGAALVVHRGRGLRFAILRHGLLDGEDVAREARISVNSTTVSPTGETNDRRDLTARVAPSNLASPVSMMPSGASTLTRLPSSL